MVKCLFIIITEFKK